MRCKSEALRNIMLHLNQVLGLTSLSGSSLVTFGSPEKGDSIIKEQFRDFHCGTS